MEVWHFGEEMDLFGESLRRGTGEMDFGIVARESIREMFVF